MNNTEFLKFSSNLFGDNIPTIQNCYNKNKFHDSSDGIIILY